METITSSDRKQLFMRLARENEKVIARVARRMCWPDLDLADDVIQDSLISALQSFVAGKFDDVNGFRPWILQILTNTFCKRHARQKRVVYMEDVEVAMPHEHETPESLLLVNVLEEHLELALGSLNNNQRETVTLVDIEGFDYAEAAHILGVPIGTVRSRLARARLHMCETVLRLRRDLGGQF